MKIAIDYREAVDTKRAGKGEYVYQLVQSLISSAPAVEFLLVVAYGQVVAITAPNVRVVTVPVSGALWHLWIVGWLLFSKPADVFFSTVSVIVPALALRVPVATTLFDFTPWRFPATHNQWANQIERLFMAMAIARSKWLFAISNFTKLEAVDIFGVNPNKIIVTPLAVDTTLFTPNKPSSEELSKIRAKYNLPQNYILFLGTIEPRKNIPVLISAFTKVAADYPQLYLVLAGGRGWYTDQILSHATSQVIVTGYVDDSDRPNLYRLAQVFVFPSLYEGFGLPPLEAMAVGTPTIVSNRASLPEVAGDVAKIVSLEDPQQLEMAIREMLIMSSQSGDELGKTLIKHAQEFSWQKTASLVLTALTHER